MLTLGKTFYPIMGKKKGYYYSKFNNKVNYSIERKQLMKSFVFCVELYLQLKMPSHNIQGGNSLPWPYIKNNILISKSVCP